MRTEGRVDGANEEDQEILVRALSTGKVLGVQAPVDRVETQLNYIFLSGDRAFKMKRAIRTPFVDFRNIDLRHKACERELSLNTSLGSPFYLRVRPVTQRPDGGFCLGGEGATIDWVVEMKRFDVSQQFNVLAREGSLTLSHVEQIAARAAAMHAAAEARLLLGHGADYRHVIQTLRKTEEEAAARLGLLVGEPAPFDLLESELARIGPLIEKRRASGKVRRGHGDLHLRNICLFEGVPTPFDALEFDERLASTDVLYDLAFLLMDLRRWGLSHHANAAMNAYWDAAGEDEEALKVLPFFMALRATVRMAIAVGEGRLEEAQDYRELAFRLLQRAPPQLVALGGLSGSGKSSVAREIAYRLPGPAGGRLLRSDVLRKRALGIGTTQRAARDVYAPEKRARLYQELSQRVAVALASGASVVADGTFDQASARTGIEAAGGNRFHAFWLEAPLSVRLARIAQRTGDASDADVNVAMNQVEPSDLGAPWRRVDARGSVREIAAHILRQVR